ncbi:OLC1v1031271C1 [Oldenlandia corymbosa var. corymbosa]|uniref:OLC1v1031271C1 n=1 Tax=Oldenlandia corymbosa var. corymbosa TaxID=529605 RepID=A0AAV1CIY6_OLDCO|nr:OLC1v1031271C1 [Oldenlandia corymbosa var. corymbosa]
MHPLSTILVGIDEPDYLKFLVHPEHLSSLDKNNVIGCPLLVQVNYFECGRVAITVSISHKVADASSISAFVNDWASMVARRQKNYVPSHRFNGASLLPPELEEVPAPSNTNINIRRRSENSSTNSRLKGIFLQRYENRATQIHGSWL